MQIGTAVPYNAEGNLNAYSIAKAGASGGCLQAAAATDAILGVTTDIAGATGFTCDVVVGGIAFVTAGAQAITQGQPITSDANGNAVPAAPAAGVNNRLVGFALDSANAGDVFRLKVQPSYMQG